MANLDRFAALDVETASRTPIRICAIGVARFELGHEIASYCSLVRAEGRVRFTHVHGLTAADLHDAPPWPDVWPHVLRTLGDIRTIVAFRAAFDRAAILAMSARHGVRLPRLRFVCAAEVMVQHRRIVGSLQDALRHLGVPFPGKPHDPLADARAAAAIVLKCVAPLPHPS